MEIILYDMKRFLPLMLAVLCCACVKEKAVSTETLPGFLRSMKWTGVDIRTNDKGEEIQWDTLTVVFVDDSLGLYSLRSAYLQTYGAYAGNPGTTRKEFFSYGTEPFRYKAVGDQIVELQTYDGRSVRMELDQPARLMLGDWDGFPEWRGSDILPSDRDWVNRARAQCGICGPELFWKQSGNILNLRGKGPMFDYPSQEKVPWYGLGITAILMDDGITSFGNWAFAGLSLKEHNVVEMKIPASVTRIGDYAFYRCSPLPVSFKKMDNLVIVGAHAFEQSALSNFTVSGNMTTIGDYAFHDIPNLRLFFDGTSVRQIGAYAFTGFNPSGAIYISSSTKQIGTHAFEGAFQTVVLNGFPSRMDQDAFVPYGGNATLQLPFTQPPAVTGLPFEPREWNLRVPSGSKVLYQAASPWNQFKTISEYNPQ